MKSSPIHIGERYTKLTIVGVAKSYKRVSKNGKQSSRKMWAVKCDCGKIFNTSGTKLRRKDIIMCCSCACSLRPQSALRYSGIENAFRRVVVSTAKKRGIEVTISAKEFSEIATRDCCYCGAKPTERPYMNKSRLRVLINGIDRVDNTKGYINGNCVACCPTCNKMKSALSYEEFISHIKKIIKNDKKM